MSDRGRAFLIFGVIGAIAAAAIYYFFEIYRPKQVLHDAQAQVEAWEARWASARGCLLGPKPASPSTREALAIHELSEQWDRGTCTPLMGKLTRGDLPNTGLSNVEAAWRELDRAAAKAAAAFAEHVDGGWGPLAKDNPLPGALDALDAARAKLRRSVELAVDTASIPPLPAAQVLALADGGDPVISLDVVSRNSAHGLVTFGKTKGAAAVQVVLPIGGAPIVSRLTPGAVRGVPDASWGAQSIEGKLAIGPMDADGHITAPIANDGKGVATISAVLGTLANGTVIYGGDRSLGIAHVANGAVTFEKPVPVDDGAVAVDPDGRAVAWWNVDAPSPATSLRAFGFGSGAVAPSPEAASTGCLTADHAQVGLIAFDGAQVAQITDDPLEVLGCSQSAVLLGGGDIVYAICGASCREPATKPNVGDAVGLVGDQLVAVALEDGVLAVRRDGHAPAYYSAPIGVLAKSRESVWSDGKVLDVVAKLPSGLVVVRAPLH
jgi:hypothetical protein